MIIEKHKELGNKWCEISKFLPGRTDNAIKNRYNSKLKKQLLGKRSNSEAISPLED